MKVKRYTGPTSRAVLAQVKAELGPDAVILSTRQVPEGTEVLALAAQDVAGVVGPATDAPPEAPRGRSMPIRPESPRRPPTGLSVRTRDRETGTEKVESPRRPAARHALDALGVRPDSSAAPPVPPAVAAAPEAPEPLLAELRALRGSMESRLAELAWADSARRAPLRAETFRDLLAAGFSAPLSRKLTQALPDDYSAEEARRWVRQTLERNLAAGGDMIERGGCFALVGPTGVGKTTTVAKLAARAVVRYGAGQVGLITTDGYRVGAQDQLRIYGRILGVDVQPAYDPEALESALAGLSGRKLVLIDTVGMGQRDPRVAAQHDLLQRPGIERLLLLNCAAQIETLEDVALAYRGGGLAGAVLTKLDEAARLGGALDVAMRHRLRLAWVADGQRVPEDLRPARPDELVGRALTQGERSAFALEGQECVFAPDPRGNPGVDDRLDVRAGSRI